MCICVGVRGGDLVEGGIVGCKLMAHGWLRLRLASPQGDEMAGGGNAFISKTYLKLIIWQ